MIFIAPEITARGGEVVQIRYMPHDLRSIEIFDDDGWSRSPIPESPPPRTSDATPTVAPPVATESTRILRWLFESKQHGVRSDDVGNSTRSELDELCAQNLAVNYDGAYRASDLALYGVFRRKPPPPTDKYPGRFTDNTRESR